MKRGWLLNLILLAAVAALGWLAWSTPSRDELASRPLTSLKPSQVGHVSLQRPKQPDLTLERSGKHWMLIAPVRARADDFQVLRMLTILEARPTARLPAVDLARFDLQSPAAVLTVDRKKFAFGSINTVTREQYVLHDGTVYAVELRHGAALPADAGALIRRVLLAENEQPVVITLPEFSVRKSDGKWAMVPSVAGTGQDDLQRYVDLWRYATAATAEPYDGRKPLGDIRITLTGGAILELGILQREPQLVLWRRDIDLQYLFAAAAGRTLLRNPATPDVAEKQQ
ncbi:MAG: DUF4340 domain-containing protein [Betaproteobacteria bacterium]|nr:DUF4340 domain-containing protein [Betaproteobacteria bacterium]